MRREWEGNDSVLSYILITLDFMWLTAIHAFYCLGDLQHQGKVFD
jgi:hypothetical protein